MAQSQVYKLYWCRHTAAQAPEVLLEDAGLTYEKITIDIEKEENWLPEYLAVNPTGYVPALVTPEGALLTESGAILLYLCERHGLELAPSPEDPLRGTFLRFLFFFCTTIPAATKRYYFAKRFVRDPVDIPWMREQSVKEQERFWRIVDDHLKEGGPFMLGDRFSVLDIQLAMLVPWHPDWADLMRSLPAVKRCFEAATARPAVRRVMIEQG